MFSRSASQPTEALFHCSLVPPDGRGPAVQCRVVCVCVRVCLAGGLPVICSTGTISCLVTEVPPPVKAALFVLLRGLALHARTHAHKPRCFGRSNNGRHQWRAGRWQEHSARRQINGIHLTFKPQNAKMPGRTHARTVHGSISAAPCQNPLILGDISRQFPSA